MTRLARLTTAGDSLEVRRERDDSGNMGTTLARPGTTGPVALTDDEVRWLQHTALPVLIESANRD